MTPSQAISRFFPLGTGYDRCQADNLLKWIDACGFEVRPKQALPGVDAPSATLVPEMEYARKTAELTPA